jgi:hypothetical protein
MTHGRWGLGSKNTSYSRALLIAAIVLALIAGTPLFGPLIATPLAVVVVRHQPFRSARFWPLTFGALQGATLYAMFVVSEWRGPLSILEWVFLVLIVLMFAAAGAATHLGLAFVTHLLVRASGTGGSLGRRSVSS